MTVYAKTQLAVLRKLAEPGFSLRRAFSTHNRAWRWHIDNFNGSSKWVSNFTVNQFGKDGLITFGVDIHGTKVSAVLSDKGREAIK